MAWNLQDSRWSHFWSPRFFLRSTSTIWKGETNEHFPQSCRHPYPRSTVGCTVVGLRHADVDFDLFDHGQDHASHSAVVRGVFERRQVGNAAAVFLDVVFE